MTDSRIFYLRISEYEAAAEQTALFRAWLQPEKRIRMDRFHQKADYLRSLLGDAAIRMLYTACTGNPPQSAVFVYGKHGKPQFAAFHPFRFSISHSGDYTVCCISDQECGVDIEEIQTAGRRIPLSVFAENEQQYLKHLEGTAYDLESSRLWTFKESYVKYTGEGLFQDFRSFSLIQQHGGLPETLRYKGCVLKSTYFCGQYALSTCGTGLFPAPERIEPASILRCFK